MPYLLAVLVALSLQATACGAVERHGEGQELTSPVNGEFCPPGRHLSDGYCCLEGAEWVPSRSTCVCLSEAGCEEPAQTATIAPPLSEGTPSESVVDPTKVETVVEEPQVTKTASGPCPPGKSQTNLTDGHCCWAEQHWSQRLGACDGVPECPEGFLLRGEDCAPGEVSLWATIKAGTFVMGSPESEEHRFPDERQFTVKLTKGFRIRSTEITQEEFQKAMGYNPSRFTECGPRCPVERVSWHEAAAFCNTLSAQAGHEPCYACSGSPPQIECRPETNYASRPNSCLGFRLPTEAEWEYATRAGIKGPIYDKLPRIAWYRGNSGSTTHRVATRQPNDWGLYDVFGNVMEWCHDWFGEYPSETTRDPGGPAKGTIRALRGGSWLINDWRVRAAYRYRFEPNIRVSYLGFRIVQTIP